VNKFHNTILEVKKIKLLPILSYAAAAIFVGKIISILSNFGNNSYIISTIGIPFFSVVVDRLTEGKLLSTFYKDWKNAPVFFHILVIINVIIYFNLFEIIKNIWTKNFYKQSENCQS
jgi:hypothetical protein